jgi:uncharacterized paraquat-inducible protein A
MTDKLQEYATIKAGIYAIGLVIIALIFGATYYNVNDRNLMAKNIDSAIAKGLDPVSVRCSYVTNTDTICVAYAASQGKK